MGDHLFEFRFRQAIVFCSHEMARELFGVSARDQRGNGNQAPISFREFRSLPDVTKKHIVRERNHFRQEGADELLSRGLFLRFGHVFSSWMNCLPCRFIADLFLNKSPAYPTLAEW